MIREDVIVSGSLKFENTYGQLVVPIGPSGSRPTNPLTGSLFYEEPSIATQWTDYGSNSSNYTVLGYDGVYLKDTTTGWVGYFPATISTIGYYTIKFKYFADSTSTLILDNDGVNDNAFNATLTATTSLQNYEAKVAITSTGSISFFLRRSAGGNITISNFRFYSSELNNAVLMAYTAIPNTNGGWEAVGNQNVSRVAFKYRQVITTAYTAGGYKDASPWKSVERTNASTDQTTYVGDLLDYPASYTSGACSKSILFVWSVNTDNAWKSATTVHSTYTAAVNMVNETNYTHQSKFDLANARDDLGTLFKETEFAWMFGGSVSNVEKFNLTNETMYAVYYPNASPYVITTTTITSSLGCSGFSDEEYGFGYGSESGNRLMFATDTFSVRQQWGNSGQQKGISSKVGKGYAGNEGTYNGGYNLRRWDYATETNIGNVAKPYPNCGEENFTMGQDHQYMIGNYDGVQNNESWKFYYATDTGSSNVAGLKPTTHGGMSSGHCGWRN